MRAAGAGEGLEPMADGMRTQLIGEYLTLVDDSAVASLPHALRITVELGVAEALSAKPLPVEELARAVGADADALRRLLRALATTGMFTEPAPGCFGLTESGRRLCPDAEDSLWWSTGRAPG